MKKDDLMLRDYNELAYEFAVRNPRVIELLSMKLDEAVARELLEFGIDATAVNKDTDEAFFSLQELYLDYKHLEHIPHTPYSSYENDWIEGKNGVQYNNFKGNRCLYHPKCDKLNIEEPREDAIKRISLLIETRGKKLQRLTSGKAFENYDAVNFFDETVYSLDPSTNTKKTINSDIEFIKEWIHPGKYLQLLPQFKTMLDLALE